MAKIFDPFDGDVAADLLAAFESQPLLKFPPADLAFGCGVYAIYFVGSHDAYPDLVGRRKSPIYVGKAVTPGTRKGSVGSRNGKGNFVVKRLAEHAKSIQLTSDLNIADFRYRLLLVVPLFTNTAESILIDHFKPLWNNTIPGFGIHAPGSGRSNQRRSDWDTLHRGRKFAETRPEGKHVDEVKTSIRIYFEDPLKNAPKISAKKLRSKGRKK